MLKRDYNRNRNQDGQTQNYWIYLKNVVGNDIGFEYSASLTVTGSYNTSWTDFGTTSSITQLYLGGVNYNAPMFNSTSFFVGKIQEFRLWSEPLVEEAFDAHVLNPESIRGNYDSSSYDSLSARFTLGNNLLTYNHFLTTSLASTHPNHSLPMSSGSLLGGSLYGSGLYGVAIYGDSGSGTYVYTANDNLGYFVSFSNDINYSWLVENYKSTSPNSGYYNPVTSKIRISNTLITSSVLSPDLSFEDKKYVTKDIHVTDVSFSPINEIDRDIIAQFGNVIDIDDIIGDARFETGSQYDALIALRDSYYKKYTKKYNYQDYIRLIKFFDGSLFKMIKDSVPARTNIQTGITIKSPLLERNRYKRNQPEFDYTGSNYTASLLIGTITGDSDHTSSIGYLSDFYTGELSGSILNIHEHFDERNYNPYLFLTASFDQNQFEHGVFNVMMTNVSASVESSLLRVDDYGVNGVTYPAEVQDYYYRYPRHANPRYEGSRLSSLNINEYNSGDDSYDKNPNIYLNVLKIGWINRVSEKNINFYDKTTMNIKYLIDSASIIYELDKTNRNLFEVQNTFKKGTYVGVSLFNAYLPTLQVSLEGDKLIFEGGFSYSPIVYRETNEDLTFNYLVPYSSYTTNLGVRAVSTRDVIWTTIDNADKNFAETLPTANANVFLTVNGSTQVGKFSYSNGNKNAWQYGSYVPLSFNGTTKTYSNGNINENFPNGIGWYSLDYFYPDDITGGAGGYATAEFITSMTVVSTANERYAMFTSPKTTNYMVNVCLPIEMNASHPDDGPGGFKLVGILEKNVNNAGWQYVTKTVMETVNLPSSRVGINEAQSFVWYDSNTGQTNQMTTNLKFNCVIRNFAMNNVSSGTKLRIKYYFIELGKKADDQTVFRGSTNILFRIQPGDSATGMFEVVDTVNSDIVPVTEYVITGGPVVTANTDPTILDFSDDMSIAYANTIFTSEGSTVADNYSNIVDPFTIQVGDIIRFDTFFARNSVYYNVIGVIPPVVNYVGSVATVVSPLQVLLFESVDPTAITSNKFAILRKKPDETSVILEYNKPEGVTSKGTLIPRALRKDIISDSANIIRPIKTTLLADNGV